MGEARQRLLDLRARLFRDIDIYFAETDGHCKSYEGTFRIIENLPDYFEQYQGKKASYSITLDLYVIGPHRHYQWDGETLEEAVSKCEYEVTVWLIDFESDQ